MKKSYTYRGVTKNTPFTADQKRAVSMRLRGITERLGHGARISETIAPVETTEPTEPTEPKLVVIRNDSVDDHAVSVIDAIIAKVYGEPVEPKVHKTTKTKGNDFYQEVIVKRAKKRAAAGTYTCEEPDCYKFGHKFSKVGWFGTDTSNGHIDIAKAHQK